MDEAKKAEAQMGTQITYDDRKLDLEAVQEQLMRLQQKASDRRDSASVKALAIVHDAFNDLRRTYQQLETTRCDINDRMERLDHYMKSYARTGNSLGVLQSVGPQMDRLCGEYECRLNEFVRVVALANMVLAHRKEGGER